MKKSHHSLLRKKYQNLMDREEAEIDILQDALFARLSRSWILVELHDALRPGVGQVLYQRFHHRYKMEFIEAAPRNPGSCFEVEKLSMREKALAVFENRLGVQEWVVMTPKN